MTANEIRHRFIEYFAKHGHTARASANIVPANDSTLLFTNAGMVPFKQQFAAPQTAPHATVTSIQKCVRAGGKHNDLDQVGFTPRHHTFFEMLGNFSFGAYGKQQAILMAWRFVREELALPTDRLRVSVLEGDDEAYSVWRDDVKLDASRIVRLGEDDNFWAMGPEGPCGPSSEIFWDTQNRCLPPDHEDRWLEFWNLVFMQYYRDSSGRLTPLEKPCIDTGMGLERMASVMQGVDNNYDTDEMRQIVASVSGGDKQTGLTHRRIIADHLRSSAFLIAEGVHPGSTGRGYVLRRIIRRAVRAGRQLGIKGPVLAPLYPSLEAAMGAAYPELSARRDAVVAVLRAEEDAFLRTLDKGLALLEHRVFASNKDTKTVCAEDVFTLYDTHGFPADLTQAIARDHGWAVDTDGFEALLQRSRQQNRERSRGELGTSRGNAGTAKATVAGEIAAACAEWRNDASVLNTRFCGYDLDPEARSGSVDSRMVAFKELSTGDGLVVINPSPFYTAGGGQEADSGTISTQDNVFTVKEAVSPASHSISGVLIISKSPRMRELLQKRGTKITATVDMERRRGCAVHHTATHLLHSALRTVVGDGVVQAGSQVRAEALRFDFTARALTSDQLDRVASIVNRAALSAAPVDVSHMTLAQAQAMGALSVRAERQRASNVRVVRIAPESVELCGGTHLRSTRAVFPFQTVSESSVGAGTRRIEAVAGDAAVLWLQQQLAHARAAVDVLAAPGVEALESRARQLDSKARAARDEADRWLAVAATSIEDAATLGTALGDSNRRPVTTCVHILPYVAAEDIACGARLAAERAAHLRSIGPMCAHVVIRGRAVALGVDPNAIPEAHAGKLLRFLLARLPGKGGGQDTLAQGRLDAPVVDSTSVSKALSQGPFPIW
ncbi:hypothetical protein IW140_002163 [Coemansia sp. RSA 1813]|nr:hypothetical protein EV178_001312 [Coemansia sp. RSA 1646]KAJ1770239.1 hypothetical protein LPJ74_003384 [Coemansia sp. RSA 1843]KAJ2090196.1 hypothetical protein IW138_002828 [Coemansia sp. RSA 986]KAJ2214602.1 hypothetical protein EV179_002861 [Coemansia sp. RSA 487]KAJ2570737.1 hypothetical protein IW140_002163 [Coemansia sp. RSA 1813]